MAPVSAIRQRAGWDAVLALLAAAFAIVAAWAGAPHLVDYDSAQFALAVGQHDLLLHQPQPPGFVGYVLLARVANGLVGDPYVALRVVAVLLLLAAMVALAALAGALADRATAGWAALFFLTSPVVLFHGLGTAIYPADAFATALVSWLAARAASPRRSALLLAAFAAGACGALRPTATLFTAPLVGLVAWRSPRRRSDVALASLALAAGVMAWLVPQVLVGGGLQAYVRANRALQEHIVARSPLQGGIEVFGAHLRRTLTVLVFGLGAARLAVLASSRRAWRRAVSIRLPLGGRTFVLAWTLPALLLMLLYHFPKPGYALALWPAACLGLAVVARRVVTGSRGRRAAAVLLGATAADVAGFFLVPTMPICCRHAWEIEEARHDPPGSLVAWPWVPRAWLYPTTWPEPLAALGRGALGRVDFFFDRTRDFDFGGVLAALGAAGLPRDDVLLLGHHAARAACYELPAQGVVHADAHRLRPFVRYRARRGAALGDTLAVPPAVRVLLVEGDAETLRFRAGSAGGHQRPLHPPLARRFAWFALDGDSLDAVWAPRFAPGAPPVALRLVRP
jgi:hypothetical protein